MTSNPFNLKYDKTFYLPLHILKMFPWLEDEVTFLSEEDNEEYVPDLSPYQFHFDDEPDKSSLNEQSSSSIQENCTQSSEYLLNEENCTQSSEFLLSKENCVLKIKKEKQEVELTPEAKKFKEVMSIHFTGSKNKPVRKDVFELLYHPMIAEKLQPIVKLRSASRDEQRDVRLYYNAFAEYQDLIMQVIKELEKEKRINYPRDRYFYLKYKDENKRTSKSKKKST